jgi:6-phosphogluconate dehydrogenase
MKIAIHGLGKMGMQIAEKLARGGHEVIAHNRSRASIEFAVGFGAHAAYSKSDVLAAFGKDQVLLWLMLPAEIVESELKEWLELVPKGSIIVDGGNSDFRHTQMHAKLVADNSSTLLDVGTSGGIHGFKNGFCMMVGGEKSSVGPLTQILDNLAKPRGAWQHFGPSGAGHYVKMVHNAIEYGMMESLAEGYRMLREGTYENLDLAAAGDIWQQGSIIASNLNELVAEALRENPELEGIDGYVAESGEARWTLEAAKECNIPLPSIQASFDVRLASQKGETNFATKVLAALRNKFGGHAINQILRNETKK